MTRNERDGDRDARPGVPHWADPIGGGDASEAAARPTRPTGPGRNGRGDRPPSRPVTDDDPKRISPEDEAVSIWKAFGRFLGSLLGG